MKNVTIFANQIGIIYKNGIIKSVLNTGSHYIGFFESVIMYDKGTKFAASINLEIAMQNKALQALTTTIVVAENEIAILRYNGIFKAILQTGTHVFINSVAIFEYEIIDINNYIIDKNIDLNLLAKAEFMQFIRAYKIEVNEKGILFVNGIFEKILEAGNYQFFKNATILHIVKTDMRALALELNGQEILTKDKAQLRINFTVQYKIEDIYKALVLNKDCDKQLYTAVQLAMRTTIGRLNIDELLEDKSAINKEVLAETVAAAKLLGIEILSCGIKDIILPADIKNILNKVLIAEKTAQANMIMRREETAATRSLLNTAKLMEDNTMLLKLKEMEYVEKIAEKINTISLSGNGQIIDQLKTIFVK
jgi:SPFH domain / Band 7 family